MESLFIGGEYVTSSASSAIEVENPATEEVTAEVPDADAADIDRAVAAARRALGREGISAFTQSKHVHMDSAAVPSPEWWFPYERPAIDEAAAAGTAGGVSTP